MWEKYVIIAWSMICREGSKGEWMGSRDLDLSLSSEIRDRFRLHPSFSFLEPTGEDNCSGREMSLGSCSASRLRILCAESSWGSRWVTSIARFALLGSVFCWLTKFSKASITVSVFTGE